MGFTFNPAYTDENATCLILGENIFAMLLVKPFFQGFSHNGICDTANAAETITALAVGSRAEVDALVSKARAAGGRVDGEAKDYLISPDLQLQHLRTYRGTSSIEGRDDVLAEITSDRLLASATRKRTSWKNSGKPCCLQD
ncbi:VOC family protein [Xanthomonas oryzae]|uniref:Uncharacterized protein n=1 Tax=Xanthomonas oryzae pv. leersiae TaxID=3112258 RepID=A0AAJ6KLZ6_9XANT|nr:hypothetical protein [Xanthomonas oryzae]UNE63054.1 hypothetical protein MML47_01575 [Xanthomonas oryzae]WIX07108.1 hypothetical protein QN060_02890 [Xanthomonas oryzae pv. oryzae]